MTIRTLIITILLAVPLAGSNALAVKIADVTRMYGQQNNVLTGVGLVYGLKGTGDGGDYLPAIRPLAKMLENFEDPTTLQELSKTGNVALVTVMATLPSSGARQGDRLDVTVLSMGAASSLRGGHLVTTLMTPGPKMPAFGIATGSITLEDPSTPTSGIVKQGLIVEENLQPQVLRDGKNGRYVTFVIDDAAASWGLASTMAKLINDAEAPDGRILATAVDQRTVEVIIPEVERERPDGFITRIQRLPLPLMPQEARVIVNTKTQTIIVTGDVEISPVVISYKGLTITTVLPKPIPSTRQPQIVQQTAVPVETAGEGGPKLQDLVTALEQLKVPTADRINIITTLFKSGKLHAKLVVDGVQP